MLARAVVGAAVVLLTLTLGVQARAEPGSDGYAIRFFNISARDSEPASRDLVVADEEKAQDFIYSRTGLMFRVQSYEPIPFHLSETSAEATSLGGNLSVRVDQELKQAGYGDSRVKNFAFYEGPGSGGRALFGESTGMVWFRNGGMSRVVVHELFHTFGLVPKCAPHVSADFHVLDDANDLMRSEDDPPASGSSGTGGTIDANHDDYFNPTLSSNGQTAVAIGGCQASQNLANMPWVTAGIFPNLDLRVVGKGGVELVNNGFCYVPSCTFPKAVGSSYTLAPLPESGWHFVGWSGACTGSTTCSVTMNTAQTVTATFARSLVQVTVKVVGKGRVKGLLPAGATCARKCSRAVPAGTAIHLSAIAAKNWRFAGWSGCSGRCVFPASPKTVTAKFSPAP